MCRVGGRRCPGEHDPAVKEARNARRRAKYAADKAAGKLVSKKKKKPTVNGSSIPESNKSVSVSKKTSKKQLKLDQMNTIDVGPTLGEKIEEQEKLVLESDQPENPTYKASPRQKKLGVGVVDDPEAKGHSLFYCDQKIVGKINYNNLTKDSYKDFGFEKPKRDWAEDNALGSATSYYISKKETDILTADQTHAVRIFTSGAFQWINGCAFNKEKLSELPLEPTDPMGNKSDMIFNGTVFGGGTLYPDSYSLNALKRETDELDAALDRGPKHQRIVYRGVSGDFESFGDVNDWVDKERSIGTEVVFNGYTSTTCDSLTAANFCDRSDGDILYQIRTPEGMAISALSSWANEEEVLLPREQRYMVVGVHKDVEIRLGKQATIVQMVAINSKGEILDGTNADPIKPLVSEDMRRSK